MLSVTDNSKTDIASQSLSWTPDIYIQLPSQQLNLDDRPLKLTMYNFNPYTYSYIPSIDSNSIHPVIKVKLKSSLTHSFTPYTNQSFKAYPESKYFSLLPLL